jgi:hypothetical protein
VDKGRRVKNQWYCDVDGQQYGPFTWEQMRAMADEGRLVAGSRVRREGDGQWFVAGQIPGLLKKKPPAAGPTKASPPASRPAAGGSSAKLGARPNKSGSSSSIHVTPASRPAAAGAGQSKLRRARATAASPPPVSGTPPASQTAVRAAGPALPVVSVAAHPVAQAPASGDAIQYAKSGPSILMIAGIVAGVLLLVGVAGVGLLAWGFMQAKRTAEGQIQATLAEAAAELEADLASAEGNPPSATPTATAAAAATTLASAAANRVDASPALAGRFKAQARWLDVTQIRGVVLGKVRLRVARTWLASDAAGTPVVPTLQGAAAEHAAAIATEAKYVFVELHIDNEAPVPRKYTSWNTGGPRSVALADQTNAILDVVPPSTTPTITRLADVTLPPGQSVSDMLVFSAPAGAIETLHLLLEKKLLAEGARDYFAFEIPLEALMEPQGGTAAATMPAVAGGAEAAAAIAAQGESAAMPEGRPPTKEELDRQFQAIEREAKEVMKSQPPAEAAEPSLPSPGTKPAPPLEPKPASKESNPPAQP